MDAPALSIVTRTQGNNLALKSGDIAVRGFSLKFEEVPVLVQAFRRMVRGLEFDICEMALTTYLCAREHGVRFTALPIFLVRAFHHGAILCNANASLNDPKELEGKRVGVNRGYTVTTGVWARAILQEEYGVDLGNITWVLSGDEHVEAYQAPHNVEPLATGQSMQESLLAGDLAAAIGLSSDHPDIRPMIENPLEAGLAAYKSRGHYPINHLVVIRDDVLEANPGLAVAVFNAFAESKNIYMEKLRDKTLEIPDNTDHLYSRMLSIGAEPLPYGIAPNRQVLEELIAHATTQGILKKPSDVGSLFAADTLELIA